VTAFLGCVGAVPSGRERPTTQAGVAPGARLAGTARGVGARPRLATGPGVAAQPSRTPLLGAARGRRSRNTGRALIAVMVLLFGGCTIQSLRDPCFFDPPPGDQLPRTITNDSAQVVALVDCDHERCRRGFNDGVVRPSVAAEVSTQGCDTETLAVADPSTWLVLGCLTEQGDELGVPADASDRRVNCRHPCAASGPRRSRSPSTTPASRQALRASSTAPVRCLSAGPRSASPPHRARDASHQPTGCCSLVNMPTRSSSTRDVATRSRLMTTRTSRTSRTSRNRCGQSLARVLSLCPRRLARGAFR